jgi:hypothetical protein
MKYHAHIYIEFSGATKRQSGLQELNAAMIKAGWKHTNKRSFVLDSDSLDEVLSGFGLIAKQSADLGPISLCNFQIEGTSGWEFENTVVKNRPHALQNILAKPYPSIQPKKVQ